MVDLQPEPNRLQRSQSPTPPVSGFSGAPSAQPSATGDRTHLADDVTVVDALGIQIEKDGKDETHAADVPGIQTRAATSSSTSRDPALTDHFRAYRARDKHLLLHKAYYVFYCGGLAFYLPFVGVYGRAAGLPAEDLGIILSAIPFATLLTSPLWGAIADRSESHRRRVMLGCLVVSTLMRCCLWLVHDFWTIFIYVFVTECIGTPVMTILDASVFALLEATSSTTHYGYSRAWGAVGWGLCAPLAGYLIDSVGFVGLFVAIALTTLPCFYFASVLPVERKEADKQSAVSGYRQLLTPDTLLFLAIVFIMGVVGAGVIGSLHPQFLLDLGANNTLLGVALLITCVAETPFFFISAPILDRFGYVIVLLMALIAYAVRVLYYAELTDPWWTMPAELLHGFTFALGWAASTRYAYEVAPPELSSTAQGLLASVQWGLGGGVGSILAGIVYQYYGPRTMYWSCFALVLFGIGLCGVMELRRRGITMLSLRGGGGGGRVKIVDPVDDAPHPTAQSKATAAQHSPTDLPSAAAVAAAAAPTVDRAAHETPTAPVISEAAQLGPGSSSRALLH